MSQVISPPDIYFNGINFNSSFYAEDTAGFTESQANKLYLRKTVADTDPFLATFSGNIATNTVSKYGVGTHTIFADDINTIVSSYGELNATADFGPQARAVKLGSGALLTVDIGKNMVATAGNYIGIGAGTSQLTNIGIGTTSGTGIQSGTGKIIIGGPGNTTSLLSDSTAIDLIKGTLSGSNITLYGTTTTGSIQLAGSQSSGTLQIGNGGSRTGKVELANSTKGDIDIGTTMGSGTNIITIGTLALGKTTIRATNLSLQETGNGTINVGNTAGTGALNINKPLTLGYATSAITALTQIGRNVEVVLGNINLPINAENTIATLTIGTAGVYIINYAFRYIKGTTATTIGLFETWFNTSTQTGVNASVQYGNDAVLYSPYASMGTFILAQNGSAIITTTAASTITFKCFIQYTGDAPRLEGDFSYYSYTRLA